MTTESFTRAAAADLLGCSESLIRQNLAAIIEIRGDEGLFVGKRLSALAIEQLREYRELGRNGYRHAYQLPIPAPTSEPTPEPITETVAINPADIAALARGAIVVSAVPASGNSIAPLGTAPEPIAQLSPLANLTAATRSALAQRVQANQELLAHLDQASEGMAQDLDSMIQAVIDAKAMDRAVSDRALQVRVEAQISERLGKLFAAGVLA